MQIVDSEPAVPERSRDILRAVNGNKYYIVWNNTSISPIFVAASFRSSLAAQTFLHSLSPQI